MKFEGQNDRLSQSTCCNHIASFALPFRISKFHQPLLLSDDHPVCNKDCYFLNRIHGIFKLTCGVCMCVMIVSVLENGCWSTNNCRQLLSSAILLDRDATSFPFVDHNTYCHQWVYLKQLEDHLV